MAAVSTSSARPSTAAIAAGAVGAVALLGAAAYIARRRKTATPVAATLASAAALEEKKSVASHAAAQAGPTARIVALASAFPPFTYPQRVYHEQFKAKIPNLTPADADFVDRVFTGTGFDTCSSYLKKEDLFRKMTRTEYTKYVKASLKDMALRATRETIEQWGGDKASITHIVFGTMTGTIHAPTLDIEIARSDAEGLGLPVGIKRLNVEGMGCLTGYRCLGLANDIARADPRNVVLLIVCDIRSALGNQLSAYEPGTRSFKSDVIASSLFRDSGAAAIITSEALGVRKPTEASKGSSAPLYEILDHRSALIPGSFDLVKYHEKDDAVIFLDIAKELPEKIKEVLKGKVEALLNPHGIKIEDCTYSVHTGGPKVLKYVAESLNISKGRMASSWYCMKKYGNLSGSSNLVVLDHWRKLPKATAPTDIVPESKKHVVCMSFGPGVGMELLLLRATSPEVGAEGV